MSNLIDLCRIVKLISPKLNYVMLIGALIFTYSICRVATTDLTTNIAICMVSQYTITQYYYYYL